MAKVDYMKKEPRDVYLRLSGMRQRSDTAKKEGDDETAYIMLKRWLDTVEWLKRHKDSKDGKSIYSNITIDQVRKYALLQWSTGHLCAVQIMKYIKIMFTHSR